MNILVVGTGQLGNELRVYNERQHAVSFLGRKDLDITSQTSCRAAVDEFCPDYIINAAAYTAVDKAETDEVLAYAVNDQGVANLAEAAKRVGSRLIHVSTDFVFNGERCVPYDETVSTDPIGVFTVMSISGTSI